ncbi:MAG TPA: TetR/AcrR family transcriptional regulator [Dyella sp.]|uniref:TetR/AcrR family transcriptional regulator n=1 Tax=Dyella sp. TaxID=1869338 RepID=UPI002F953FFE
MKVTREQFAEHRERILEVASSLFREKGFDGIGIADIMKAAGLTHGGFYRHFASKDDLIDQASRRALLQGAAHWERIIGDGNPAPAALARLLQTYLSEAHRDASGKGCTIAALGVDTSRQQGAVRKTFAQGLEALVEKIAALLPERARAARRRRALAVFAQMVGALVMARAVDDPVLSKEILTAAASGLDARGAG